MEYDTKGGARCLMAAEGQHGAGCVGHWEGSQVEPLFKRIYGRGLGNVLGEIIPFDNSSWEQRKFIGITIRPDGLKFIFVVGSEARISPGKYIICGDGH